MGVKLPGLFELGKIFWEALRLDKEDQIWFVQRIFVISHIGISQP